MRFSILVILCLWANVSVADSWLEKLKNGYDNVKERFTSETNDAPQALKPLPTNMPVDWHYSYYHESVFNSKIAVLQTGLQHKESVLLVHGLGQVGMQSWYSVIPFLASSYHVIAIDLPGFGYSESPQGRYSPTNYANVLHQVSNTYGKQNLSVIGHSMGGAVSIRFASMFPEKVNKLVLVDVAGILEKTAFVKHAGRLPIDDSNLPAAIQNIMAQVNDFSGSIVELTSINSISKYIESSEITWELIKDYPNINAAMGLIEEDFSQPLMSISSDTRIIWGELDRVAPLRTGKVLKAKISNAQLNTIKGAEHVPMISHTYEFLELLGQAMEPVQVKTAPEMTEQSLYTQEMALGQRDSLGDLICKDKQNNTYTGFYDSVTLINCSNISLINVNAKELVLVNSLVNAENLIINSNQHAIAATESVLTITNGNIESNQAILLSGSRLDIAGVNIIAPNSSIDVDVQSTVIFSVSAIHEQSYQGSIHGAFELEKQNIASKLKASPNYVH